MTGRLPAGAGLGWRPETALLASRRALPFVEVIAESVPVRGPLPAPLRELVEAGVPVVPHGVSLSLGSGSAPDPVRLERLALVAERLRAPLVSEHVAFVRGAGLETEHLLPVPHTQAALDIVVENVQRARDALPVPLALENIASLFRWPEDELTPGAFLGQLLPRSGAALLLDVANLHADAVNFGLDVHATLDALPLERLAYAHIAGSQRRDGFLHDTHAHPVSPGALEVLAAVRARTGPLPVLLERDDRFGTQAALQAELDLVEQVATEPMGDEAATTGEEDRHVA
ncbi:MAG: DUF692 domain-containing protein [Myxococcota bacterium]